MARLSEATLPPPAKKRKQAVGLLSSAPDNELLNAVEITPGSAMTFMVELLREMLGGVSDVCDSRFLALASHLACSTKQ